MMRGSKAEVIWPKTLLLKFVVGLLLRKLFVRLKASTRNSICFDSLKRKALDNAASNCHVFVYVLNLGNIFKALSR